MVSSIRDCFLALPRLGINFLFSKCKRLLPDLDLHLKPLEMFPRPHCRRFLLPRRLRPMLAAKIRFASHSDYLWQRLSANSIRPARAGKRPTNGQPEHASIFFPAGRVVDHRFHRGGRNCGHGQMDRLVGARMLRVSSSPAAIESGCLVGGH